ncbi:MAG: VWA domain-containing protein [Clostridia bacterium]|nr:VWA domain-containing protein [Clostridia bacterium]
MGFFTKEPAPVSGKVSLTKNEELNKKLTLRKDIIDVKAQSSNIRGTVARVVFALDHSGSMRGMYRDGTVQDLLERVFPMAMYFDDNCELDFYWFDSTFKELESVTPDVLDGYVQKVILSKNDHFGGTCYAPIIHAITKRYAKKNKSTIPTFVIFITDGANSDKADSKKVLIEASKYNIFWKFIGIGKDKFEFLEKLDTMTGRVIDNANFASVNNLASLSDDELYTLLLDEYADWLARCRAVGIPVGN